MFIMYHCELLIYKKCYTKLDRSHRKKVKKLKLKQDHKQQAYTLKNRLCKMTKQPVKLTIWYLDFDPTSFLSNRQEKLSRKKRTQIPLKNDSKNCQIDKKSCQHVVGSINFCFCKFRLYQSKFFGGMVQGHNLKVFIHISS